MEWWREPFFQVALPVMITFALATLYQGKRIDDLSKRIDDLGKRIDDVRTDLGRRIDEIVKRLDNIERKLDGHAERIAKLEERTGPIARGR